MVGQVGGMNLSDYFHEKLSKESIMPEIITFIQNQYGFQFVSDLREKKEFQDKDIDLLFKDSIMDEIPIEVKIRTQIWNDIAIETKSSTEYDTLGYIYKSQATFLAYAFVIDNTIKSFYLLHLPRLKEWFERNKHKYKPKYAPNPPNNPIYHTEFYPIPIRDIPFWLFFSPINKLVGVCGEQTK
jgi:hypothetical protein